jgi:beta-glucanase (GH16 family)
VAAACGSDDSEAETATTTTAPAPTTTTTTTTTMAPTTTIATPPPIPIDTPDGWELVWSDEFDGDEIDLENWTYDIGGWGWGNGELQYYTDRPENARLQNGLLVIEGRQERFEDNYYTSARLLTQGLQEFQYGRIEARTKVPEGKGMWPAFWMLGAGFEQDAADQANRWPFVGEIDIMEYVGKEPDKVFGTVHGPGYAGAGSIGKSIRLDDEVADDWHTYGVEWDEDGIRWFFDGEQYFELGPDDLGPQVDWVFDRPFFIILNLALGGQFPGPIGLDVEFPKYFYVDYVRVWQQVDTGS